MFIIVICTWLYPNLMTGIDSEPFELRTWLPFLHINTCLVVGPWACTGQVGWGQLHRGGYSTCQLLNLPRAKKNLVCPPNQPPPWSVATFWALLITLLGAIFYWLVDWGYVPPTDCWNFLFGQLCVITPPIRLSINHPLVGNDLLLGDVPFAMCRTSFFLCLSTNTRQRFFLIIILRWFGDR